MWLTFDCYGTLADWRTGIAGNLSAFLDTPPDKILELHAKHEADVEREALQRFRTYREVLQETMRRIAAEVGVTLTDEQADCQGAHFETWKPFPDTAAALQRLSQRYSLGILSNVDHALFGVTAKMLEVDFELVITAEDVRSYKPATAHFDEMLKRVGSKDQVIHCAQSLYHDIAPTRALGIPNVWVNRLGEPVGEVVPDREVSGLAALADVLLET